MESPEEVKVGDLKEQSGPGPHPILYCTECGGEYSADKSDYFMLPDTEIMMCCDIPLQLVMKTTTYNKVT